MSAEEIGNEWFKKIEHVDIKKPKYDQSTYWGRAKHFLAVTNPLNVFLSSAVLDHSKEVVTGFCNKTLKDPITEEELWRQKYIYDSAFHPDTGEKMNVIGRMSAQVPMNMIITGAMMTFYKTNTAIIFWQWLNQSFNALVNYTNRSGDAVISTKQLAFSYTAATTGAVTTAVTLNHFAKRLPPITARFVPFAAVIAANCINIPCMRYQEIENGTPIFDPQNGNRLGDSTSAAKSGIFQVLLSRITMAAPGMMCTPVIMDHFERKGTLAKYPMINLPLQLTIVGLFLTFATPLGCAVFKQQSEIKFSDLEVELQQEIEKKLGGQVPEILVYNKGL